MNALTLAVLRLLCHVHPLGHEFWLMDEPTCVRCKARWTP